MPPSRALRPTAQTTFSNLRRRVEDARFSPWLRYSPKRNFTCSSCRYEEGLTMATWLFSNPSPSTLSKMISQIPQLEDARECKRRRTATFLITPSMTDLFTEPGGLQSQLMNHIYARMPEGRAILSYVAVVDGLPGPAHFERQRESNSPLPVYEGIAMSLARVQSFEKAEQSLSDRPVVRFHDQLGYTNTAADRAVLYEVPIANTLFVNGQPSTFYLQQWTYDGDLGRLAPTQEGSQRPEQLQSMDMSISHNSISSEKEGRPEVAARMTIDLEALTWPVAVTSSMGNIVREIQLADGSSSPASAELESIVPDYVKRKKRDHPDGTLRVFALIYPSEQEHVEIAKPIMFMQGDKAEDRLQDWLLAGASLHEVTSGGGGWGNKQGLLSLDPAVSFLKQDSSKSGLLANLDIEADELEMPKTEDLVRPGCMVQFFAHFQIPPPPANLRPLNLPKGHFFCFATTLGLNSSDFLSTPATLPSDQVRDQGGNEGEGRETDSRMRFLPRRFGMLTTGPIVVSKRELPRSEEEEDDDEDDNDEDDNSSDNIDGITTEPPDITATFKFKPRQPGSTLITSSLVNVPDTMFTARKTWKSATSVRRVREAPKPYAVHARNSPTPVRRSTIHARRLKPDALTETQKQPPPSRVIRQIDGTPRRLVRKVAINMPWVEP